MRMFSKICLCLLILGGINWGLIGICSFNMIGWMFGGATSALSRIVYVVYGLAALGAIPALFMRDDDTRR